LSKLKRDSLFWTVAGQATILNFFLGGFGPSQSLLRDEQGTSLTVAGLHGTMMGLAAIIAGLIHPHLNHKYGRRNTSWLGLAIFTIGLPVFALGPSINFTLPAVLFSCVGFNFVILNMVTLLSHHYPQTPDLAVSQSNGINAVGFVIGTVLVGTLASLGLSWRIGLLLCIPAAFALYYYGKDKIIDNHVSDAPKQSGKLGFRFWIAWFGFFTTISSEFATSFWSAALLSNRTGATAAFSTLCVAALGTGFGIGRWFIPIWMRKTTLDVRLKTILSIQLISFMLYWLSHNLVFSLIMLLFVGIGISGQFPMTMVRILKLSGDKPDLAMGKSAYAAGLAIALAPFMLGFLGDRIGISKAYLMVPLLIIASFAAIYWVPSEAPQKR
jgi:predicted MFS family arabinose efflux permease